MNTHRVTPRTSLLLGALLVCLLISSALRAEGARAFVTHEYLSQITGVPQVGPHGEAVPIPGPLGGIKSAATDASGRLLLNEACCHQSRLDEFDGSSGAFLGELAHSRETATVHPVLEGFDSSGGAAIGYGTGERIVYEAGRYEPVAGSEQNAVQLLDESGAVRGTWNGNNIPAGGGNPGGSFGGLEMRAVAVDRSGGLGWSAGDVYVAQSTVVNVFKPGVGGAEEFVGRITGTEPEPGVTAPFRTIYGIAVSGFDGDVYVVDNLKNVDIFKPTAVAGSYEFLGTLSAPPPSGEFQEAAYVAVDGANGEVYVSDHKAVDEFSAAGAYLGSVTETGGGPLGPVEALAAAGGHLYVVEAPSNQRQVADIFGPDVVLPDVVTGQATGTNTQSATLNGTVNPDSAGPASCSFSWGPTPLFGETVGCDAPVPDGGSPVPVTAHLAGLAPDTTYYYRLQASNVNGTSAPGASQTATFKTSGPGIHSSSALDVSATSATLQTSVDPDNATTRYYFQYGPSTAYGFELPGAPGAFLGSGEGDVEASQRLQGLAAGSVYHYRVVAVSEPTAGAPEAFYGPDRTFTTQPANTGSTEPALPDGREWELVSPPDKHGSEIKPIVEGGVTQASASGNAVTFVASAPIEEQPLGNSNGNQIIAARGSDGWASQDIATPHEHGAGASVGQGQEYKFFSSDLSLSVVEPFGGGAPLLSEAASEATPYLRSDFPGGTISGSCGSTCYLPLVTGCPSSGAICSPRVAEFADISPGIAFARKVQFVDATPDLSHVLVHSDVGLLKGFGPGLYEWSAGSLAFVGEATGVITRVSISDDGSRVAYLNSNSTGNELLLRDMATRETVVLSAVVSGQGEGIHEPVFSSASRDLSTIFFTDPQSLTQGTASTPGHANLYECRLVGGAGTLGCALAKVSPRSGGPLSNGTLGTSADGSWTYFVTDSAGSPAEPDLYVRHGSTTHLITALSNDDSEDWYFGLPGHTSAVSSNGEWLAFMSDRSLTGYDNRDAQSNEPDEEVYLYKASTGALVCASCDPSGARPAGVEYKQIADNEALASGDRVWPATQWIAANIPGWTPYALSVARYQSRYLSNEGRLFFNSSDALTPSDVNGTEDVYEYEPSAVPQGGAAPCTAANAHSDAATSGCVNLISSGTSGRESAFLDASESGGDVFFLTSARLASADIDTSVDVYDAHECTVSEPCFETPGTQPPPCDTGDSCKAAPSPQPDVFGVPASGTFSGAGNVAISNAKKVVKSKRLTRAQQLARALRVCRRERAKKRAVCERRAKARFGPGAAGRATTKKKGKG